MNSGLRFSNLKIKFSRLQNILRFFYVANLSPIFLQQTELYYAFASLFWWMLLLIVFSKLCLFCTNPGVFKEIFETKSNITFWTFFLFLFQIYHCIMTAIFFFPSSALVLLSPFSVSLFVIFLFTFLSHGFGNIFQRCKKSIIVY